VIASSVDDGIRDKRGKQMLREIKGKIDSVNAKPREGLHKKETSSGVLTLNRIKTKCGRNKKNMHKCGSTEDDKSECGEV